MLGPRWLLACLLPLVTLQGALVAAKGIPVCAPGTQTCGLSGCYTPMFANCIQAQCFPKLLGMVSPSAIACLPYMNSCNGGTTYCSSGETCLSGVCAPAAGAAVFESGASRPATPLKACAVARAQQHACAGDATPLLRASGAKLGYADTLAGECFESAAFKCCAEAGAGGVDSIVYSCKGVAILESAMSTIVNGTNTLLQSAVAAVETAAANGTAGANGTVGGAAAAGGGAAAGGTAPGAQQPALLTPLLQNVANMVTNMSAALLAPLSARLNNANGTSNYGAARAKAAPAAAQAPANAQGHVSYPSGAASAGVPTALAGALLLFALAL